ncbi:MAG: tetraacyldisaccharide 4'-kinase [Prevotellaceae bacterium]|jgi:tetraacyldisaccharide 4'-kinase|nr:tetraacyldisaccharide 4'-kinase [Prevotellaceae bacterium]
MKKTLLRLLLQPFSFVYGAMVGLRNNLYDRGILKSRSFGIPLISVGNVTVGGTGKTPHVEYLIELLKERFSLAVLSRGYGRRTRGFRYVASDDTNETAGDEPLQIKLKYPDVVVAVDGSRVRGTGRLLRDHPKLELVLLDDAFQHRRIAVSLHIVLSGYSRPAPLDSLLPVGRLRDKASSLHRADLIVISKCPDGLDEESRAAHARLFDAYGKPLYFGRLRACAIQSAFGKCRKFDSRRLLAVAGIANPDMFFSMVEQLYPRANIERLEFEDHHDFSERDAALIASKAASRLVITTEKDAVRLRRHIGRSLTERFADKVFTIPVKAEIDDSHSFNQHIIDHVIRKSKTNG